LKPGRLDGKRSATGRKAKEEPDKTEHCLLCGIPVLALSRQRLALLGALPSGAGPKAQMSRASVAEVTSPSFNGLSFHTSKYMDGPICPPIIYCMFICTILFFLLWMINVCYLIWYYWDRKSSAARLRDLSFQQHGPVLVKRTEKEVDITFPSEVWISPNGKRYHTSASCCALTSTTPILKGICSYCKTRESASAAGSEE